MTRSGITLTEFISTVPEGVRLGQHFVNQYWGQHDDISCMLYHATNETAEIVIKNLMGEWQWDSLPNPRG